MSLNYIQLNIIKRLSNKFFIKQILSVSWAMWKYRNETLHGINHKDIRANHLLTLQKQVELSYKRAKVLEEFNRSDIQQVFKLPIKKHNRHGVAALEAWLKLATNVLEVANERANSKLKQWLIRKSTYIEKETKAKE